MKKLFCLCLILLMCLPLGGALAAIMKPEGVDESFQSWTGIEAKRAVVLCESLSVHADRNGSSEKVATLSFGDTFLTWDGWDGWCNCYYSDGAEAAWVRSNYVVIDPPYYVTEGETAVYAYMDTLAPRVALLNAGEELPVIAEMEEWCVVSLRGAAGWIKKTPQDTAHQIWFQPESLRDIVRAELTWSGGSSVVNDPQVLVRLSALLADTRDMGSAMAGCPFGYAYLTLTLGDGSQVVLDMACDSCCVFRIDMRDYRYANSTDGTNDLLFDLFPGYEGI